MMLNARPIHTEDSDGDSLSSSSDIGVVAKLSQLGKNLVTTGRRNSIPRNLSALDSDDDDMNYNNDELENTNNEVNERYEEQKQGNLYGFIRSVRHTEHFGMTSPGVSAHGYDEGDSGSEFSMPRVGEEEEEGSSGPVVQQQGEKGGVQSQSKPATLWHVPKKIDPINASERSHSTSESSSTNNNNQQQQVKTPRSMGLFAKFGGANNNNNEATNNGDVSHGHGLYDKPNNNNKGEQQPQRRRGSNFNRSRSVIQERRLSNQGRERRESSFTSVQSIGSGDSKRTWPNFIQRLESENYNDGSSSVDPAATATTTATNSGAQQQTSSRLSLVKRNVSNAASDTESFRELQKRMKEQGAFTGAAIMSLLNQDSSSHVTSSTTDNGVRHDATNNHRSRQVDVTAMTDDLYGGDQHHHNDDDSHRYSQRSVDTGKSVETGDDDSLGMESVRGKMEKLHQKPYVRTSSQASSQDSIVGKSVVQRQASQDSIVGKSVVQRQASQDSIVGKSLRRCGSQQSLSSSIHSINTKEMDDNFAGNKKPGMLQGWKEAKNASWSSLLGGRGMDTTPSVSTGMTPPQPVPPPPTLSKQLTTRFKNYVNESYRGDDSVKEDDSTSKWGSDISGLKQQQKVELDARLTKDPIFAGSDENLIPFVAMPSREGIFESLLHAMSSAADEGESCLLSIMGDRFVGKSRLVDEAIEKAQSWGMGFTVLRSHRSETDSLTSFYPFRAILSTALRDCDAMTMRSDESFDMSGWEKEGAETDAVIVQRLVQRKILNKSDQLMLGRILPDVMNKDLLSLLKGRGPAAITKDIAASIFKLIIPIQPVVMVFEADGNGGDIDSSSWSLIEELLQSAGEQCPQMLMLAMSRNSISIPKSLEEVSLEIGIDKMTKADSERFVQSLFVGTEHDVPMTVHPKIFDAIYARANGCPMFTQRAISWARQKRLIDVDEITNFVDWNSPDEDIFPHTLNEEILEVINNLSDNHLDALKIATCLGFTIDLSLYEALRREGFDRSIEEMMSSHGIFHKLEKGVYRWKNAAAFEAVESIIISNERREIHERIAGSLQRLSSKSKGIVSYARHHAMAKQWEKAFDLYMLAGKKAEEEIDFTGAVRLYMEAKPCLSRTRTKPSLKRKLSPHAALGSCYRELVRYDEAEEELEFCLEQTMDVPEDERDLAYREIEIDVITTLAKLKQAQSKYGEALELYERVLPTARGTKELQSNNVWLAHHVANCAEIYRKSGDLSKAGKLHAEALGYRESAAKENLCSSLELALSFTQLGTTEAGLGNHSEAYNLHRRALSIRMEQLDFYHSLVSESLNYCADALQALGRGREGISLGMHAVKIRKHIFGALHPAYAHALSVLASCYHCIGRSYDALSLMKECLDICEKFFSENHANLIPNLMLYGSVLYAVGDEMARSVYERALAIHNLNFKGDQNAKQLQRLKESIEDLNTKGQQAPVSLDMPIPPIRPESGMVHAIVCADFGRRASDEFMLAIAASLQQMGTLKLISVVAVTPPQVLRADVARGALDSLLLPDVPVAYSRSSSIASGSSNAKTFKSDYGNSSPHVNNTGVELIIRTMMKAPEKSLVIMCTACLGDVGEVIETQRDLFASKVKEVVLLGFGAKPVRRRSSIEPEESGMEADDELRRKVFLGCQELGIATVMICKEIALGFPFPSTFVDDLAETNHMVSLQIQHREEMHSNGIWELTKQLQQEARGYRGSLKNVDLKAFCKYTLGNKTPPAGQHNIWPLVKSINLELVLGLLCCIPMYRDYFKWEVHSRGGVDHKISRHMSSSAGIIKPDNLSSEVHMLIGVALRTALNNTSC